MGNALPRRHDGFICVLGSAFLEGTQDQVGISRGAVLEFLSRKTLFASDEHAMLFPEVFLDLDQGVVVALVQLFGGVEHGCVSQFECLSHMHLPPEKYGLVLRFANRAA